MTKPYVPQDNVMNEGKQYVVIWRGKKSKIYVDKELPYKLLDKFNNLENIEIRSLCIGHRGGN